MGHMLMIYMFKTFTLISRYTCDWEVVTMPSRIDSPALDTPPDNNKYAK